jgi:hypothetical protein
MDSYGNCYFVTLPKPGPDDSLGLIGTSYSQIRRYAPALLETFKFKAAPVAEELLKAIQLLRKLDAAGIRDIPKDAPSGFIQKRWEPLVRGDGGLERRFYEPCLLSEVKNALRSGEPEIRQG